jgi:uncharacterized DUF497 family protein
MNFEWNEDKRMSNIAKHGLDFADARVVFEDECRISSIDTRRDYGEEREVTIGRMFNALIAVVVHTNRNNKIRIISVRKAKQKERNLYYGNR